MITWKLRNQIPMLSKRYMSLIIMDLRVVRSTTNSVYNFQAKDFAINFKRGDSILL